MLKIFNKTKKDAPLDSQSNLVAVPNKKAHPVVDFLQSFTLAIIFSILIFSIFTPSEVEGSSMEPSFHNGERVYTNRLPQWLSDTSIGDFLNLNYNRGDVIVFYKPGMTGSLIKRVIGLPGDEVLLSNGKFYVNGQLLDEKYISDDLITKEGTFLKEGESVIVPEDNYFVAGDNRGVSNDSRYIGFIKKDWMQGKVVFRLWPLDKFGLISSGEYALVEN